jgi:sialate O-acetylesterase
MNAQRWSLSLLMAVLAGTPAAADPVLSPPFTDHMVLQRDRPVRVAGTAEAGEHLSVRIDDRVASTVAAGDGSWSVELPAMPAGGPFDLVVDGRTEVALHDVMVGEVWVASGQSNMSYPVVRSEGADAELARADRPAIRLFKVPEASSRRPGATVAAQWTRCTAETVRDFSAVGYFFARDLREALDVPVGVLQSAWPGTQAEAWTSAASLAADPELRPIVDRWQAASPATRDFADEGAAFDLQLDDFQLLRGGEGLSPAVFSSFDDRGAGTREGGLWQTRSPGHLSLIRPGSDGSGYAARFAGRMSLEAHPSLRASVAGSAETTWYDLSPYVGMSFTIRGHGCFRVHLEEPATADGDNYSSGPVCASEAWQTVSLRFQDFEQAGWGVVRPLTLDHVSAVGIDATEGRDRYSILPPAGLYNAMILPLTGYTIRGAVWYQGEGNADRARQYATLLPTMIGDWRRAWREETFPFLIVQLPGWGQPSRTAEDANWAELREAQAFTAKRVPAAGLAVAIDLGEPGNLHPPRKAEVAHRLALVALDQVYGRPVESSGPVLASVEDDEGRFVLRFSHAEGLAARGGGPVEGFAIAGADRRFVPAAAAIRGATVEVSSPLVPRPVAVRYAWAASPICNLVNGAGLPAAPFRTDDWPGVTDGAR